MIEILRTVFSDPAADIIGYVLTALSIAVSVVSVFWAARWAVLLPRRMEVQKETFEKVVYPLYKMVVNRWLAPEDIDKIDRVLSDNEMYVDRRLRAAFQRIGDDGGYLRYQGLVIAQYEKLVTQIQLPKHIPDHVKKLKKDNFRIRVISFVEVYRLPVMVLTLMVSSNVFLFDVTTAPNIEKSTIGAVILCCNLLVSATMLLLGVLIDKRSKPLQPKRKRAKSAKKQ